MLEYTIEKELWEQGFTNICGVDEAGRGPLCGPVVAAAVILPPGLYIEGLNDSKKITEKKREYLFDIICDSAIAFSIEQGSVNEINSTDILSATMNTMRRAINNLSIKPNIALVDGNIARDFPVPARTVIHGDAISPSIAAASILAKVTRDRLCLEMDKQFPQYNIAKHKGYGTAVHIKAIKEIGPCCIHRKTFIKNFWAPKEND